MAFRLTSMNMILAFAIHRCPAGVGDLKSLKSRVLGYSLLTTGGRTSIDFPVCPNSKNRDALRLSASSELTG